MIKEKHNYVGTPTYRSWYNMKSRCNNPKYSNYQLWGGRGITYDKRWNRFTLFLEDVGERPGGTSLDRINNDGNYCKENCRWSSRKEQMNNMRSNFSITCRGVTKNLTQWAEDTGLKRETISARIKKYGWAVEDALTVTPEYNHVNRYKGALPK